MKIHKLKIVGISLIFLLTMSALPTLAVQSDLISGGPAKLTGVIYDQGDDTDGDGLYNYLMVGVEVDVTEAGNYQVQVNRLRNTSGNYTDVYNSTYLYLDFGIHTLNISLDGLAIYLSRQNPRYVGYIGLLNLNYTQLDYRNDVPLSREYSYGEFDSPGAFLTGVIFDEGLDTDEDGTYNYLQIGVQVNVSDPDDYWVNVSGLLDASFNYIDGAGGNNTYLNSGPQTVYVSLEGSRIYLSLRNPRYVSYISLQDTFYQSLNQVPLSREYSYLEFDPPAAVFTGTIYDRGVDTDGDDLYNYLEIDVQVDVTEAGDFTVSVSGLHDYSWNYINVWNSTTRYMDVGVGFLNVSLSGYGIRGSHTNASFVNGIYLSSYPISLYNVALSREYKYTWFDAPAFLVGIRDKGIDTDSDGKYNLLEISAQINVSESGNYDVYVEGLLDSADFNYTYIDVYASTSLNLEAGLQSVNLTLDGMKIRLSRRNPRYVGEISLRFWTYAYGYYQDYMSQVPLSRQYDYAEFDPPGAMLTGKISDKGIDNDSDGRFDWLEVGVELNVTDAGTYWVWASGLETEDPDYPWKYTIYAYDSKEVNLNVGIQEVSLYFYGPEIYISRHSPANVSSMGVGNNQGQYDTLYRTPLSRTYSYTEFDAPFWDAETKLVVYPDGRVTIEGSLENTNMLPRNTGPTSAGFFNLAANDGGAQANAGLTLAFPGQTASQFPLNSTTASLLATYQNGLLNLRMNSTMTLPPGDNRYQPYGQWPFNATDGTIALTYSGGILNLEINGETTLPPAAKSQFPFNSTDLTVVGSYAANALDGTLTFSVSDDFTFDDVNVDFTGSRTDLILNGTLTVVFGVPFGSLVIRNSTELEQLITSLRSTILGESGIVWNMTNGLLNVTNFDVDYSLLDSWGAKVTFEVEVQGDFVQALAYLMSSGRNTELLYQTLEDAYSSAKDGAFLIDYKHDTSKATVELNFSYDLKQFVDNALTTPPGTLAYAMASYSMYPTLAPGDVVFIEPVSNYSNVVADPTNGDIIAFYRPDYPYYNEVIIHRVINRTIVNGTQYFQTKGDNDWAPDSWLVPESLVIGKVVRRVPLLGYLLLSNMFGYYWYQNTAVHLDLAVDAFSSLQEASVNLSYSSVYRLFNLKLALIYKLKELADNVSQKLPDMWPPETPDEIKDFFEKLLNTTYASVSSAQFSSDFDDGVAEFDATVNIEGDLNKEINYVKDLYIQFYRASLDQFNMSVPWQFDFIDQTGLDLSKLEVTAQLGETSFESTIQGVTIVPPRQMINATNFTLKQLFNITTPQYPWQSEFPEENQRLRITIEGGINATHMVSLYRATSVPEPNTVGPYQKSMIWFNQTFSSLKDLIFRIGPRLTGTLTVKTKPIAGEVFVNGESWGSAAQSKVVDVGFYDVSFGEVTGYKTPEPEPHNMVYADQETIVTGTYVPINGTLTITTTPVSGEVIVNGVSWGKSPQSRVVQVGTYTISFGAREGYTSPANQIASVAENTETSVEGIYQAIPGIVVAEIIQPELVSEANPFILNATRDAAVYLIISDISHPITVIVKNLTEPDCVQSPPGSWKFLGNYVKITGNNTEITLNATIRIYYTLEQLEASGIDESTLSIGYCDPTTAQWVLVESGVNTDERYVWAIVDHFSTWAVMGQLPQPANLLPYLIVGVVLIGVIIAMAALYLRKRRQPKPTSSPAAPAQTEA